VLHFLKRPLSSKRKPIMVGVASTSLSRYFYHEGSDEPQRHREHREKGINLEAKRITQGGGLETGSPRFAEPRFGVTSRAALRSTANRSPVIYFPARLILFLLLVFLCVLCGSMPPDERYFSLKSAAKALAFSLDPVANSVSSSQLRLRPGSNSFFFRNAPTAGLPA
jgi:hypothetical protein